MQKMEHSGWIEMARSGFEKIMRFILMSTSLYMSEPD